MGSYFIVRQIKNDLLKGDQMNEKRKRESDEGWKKGCPLKVYYKGFIWLCYFRDSFTTFITKSNSVGQLDNWKISTNWDQC